MDQGNFNKKISVSEEENMLFYKWISSLPLHEQQQYNKVDQIHEQVVAKAIKNNDAKLVRNEKNQVVEIVWRDHDTHIMYCKQMGNLKLYLSFRQRYQDSKK